MKSSVVRSFLLGIALTYGAVGNSPAWAVLPISQVPLTLPPPVRPQVLFAIGNSESMDGDLNGAILTGAGKLPVAVSSLSASSSPTNFIVPVGFTPPVSGGVAGSSQVNTSLVGPNQVDNSPSRLNIAKAGISAIISQYVGTTQFALEDYNAANGSVFRTWVYQMSRVGGFTFSPTNVGAPPLSEYVPNPCFNYLTASPTVSANCAAMVPALYTSAALNSNPYMLVAQSSDDANVVDVLYAGGGIPSVFVDFNGPTVPTPFPPNFTLAQYNAGGVTMGYRQVLPAGGATVTGPTNAGFVPFTPQVLYAERGFGYNSNASATSGTIVVPMKDAGPSPSVAAKAAVVTAFLPALSPETNVSATTEIKSVAVQSPIAGLMQQANTYLTSLRPLPCNWKQYVVLISDGLPTQDLINRSWPPLGSASAAGYGVTATFNGDGSLNTTNDQALTDSITKIAALHTSGVDVYIVGMGAGVNPVLNPQAAATLKAMAVAGGTTDYFPATTPAALVADLKIILDGIQNANVPLGTLPVLGARLGAGSLSYTTSFAVAGHDWIGDLEADSFNADGSLHVPLAWTASTALNALSNVGRDGRRMVIDTVAGTTATHTAVSFDDSAAGVAALGGTRNAQLAFLGLNQPLFDAQYGAGTSTAQVIDYLKGDAAKEQRNAGVFRNRSGVLGDIVNSVPEISSSRDDFGYSFSLAAFDPFSATLYPAFLLSKSARNPNAVAYVGANDGMLHAFDGRGLGIGGSELFGFIPNSVTGNLGTLLDPFYSHQYFVDGGTNVTDACLGLPGACAWSTVLVGSTGAGGSGAYALDVSNPATFGPANVLWDVTSATDNDIGTNVGRPIVMLGEDHHWYAAFGNGYNSVNSNPVLILVDLTTGVIAKKISANVGLGLDNGIGQIAAIDTNGDGAVDAIYGGDYQGNLWKFDLSGALPAAWGLAYGAGVPLYVANDGLGNRQPITGGLEIAPGPLGGQMLYFGTGKFFLIGDNAAGAPAPIQSLYGVWDNGSADLTGRASLQVQTISGRTVGALTTRQTSSNPVTYTLAAGSPRGFFMDLLSPPPTLPALSADGENFFGTPRVQNGIVFFTTYEPGTNPCAAGGTRWEYGLSALTGASALDQLHIGTLGGALVCPGGSCGAVQIGTGAPVLDTAIVIPARATCNPGVDPGCPIPARVGGIPPPPVTDSSLYSACTIIVRASGAPALALPRPCGRQSWRQVR